MQTNRLLKEVEAAREEMVELTRRLIQFPTVNPPGRQYGECADWIAAKLKSFDFDVDLIDGPSLKEELPRLNVLARRRGSLPGPVVHLNGHFDVVPPGEGWTVDPFEGVVEGGKIYGRGSADMKAGLVSAVMAAEAVRRAGIPLSGTIEISATVDEESGGHAGVAHLCRAGYVRKDSTDFVIIPEPLDPDRICLGHRGVYWARVTVRGRIGHGSMPFLGVNAIELMGLFLERVRREIQPQLAKRWTEMPVVPEAARRPSLNLNAVFGGQFAEQFQTPCVADSCQAVLDRRFLPEEDAQSVREELQVLIDELNREVGEFFELGDLMWVHPVWTPPDSRLVASLQAGVEAVFGRPAILVASPGTYDHKHFSRIAGIRDCVAYGPGRLEIAHQPDEWCDIQDLENATKVLAMTLLELVGKRE